MKFVSFTLWCHSFERKHWLFSRFRNERRKSIFINHLRRITIRMLVWYHFRISSHAITHRKKWPSKQMMLMMWWSHLISHRLQQIISIEGGVSTLDFYQEISFSLSLCIYNYTIIIDRFSFLPPCLFSFLFRCSTFSFFFSCLRFD